MRQLKQKEKFIILHGRILKDNNIMIKLKQLISEQFLGTTGLKTGFNLSKAKPAGYRIRPTGKSSEVDDGTVEDMNFKSLESSDKQVKYLFDQARTWPSNKNDWEKIKPIAIQIKKEMTGVGAGKVLDYLKQIKTESELAALVKNFKFDDKDLFDWLDSEYTIRWVSVAAALQTNFGKYMKLMKSSGLYA